MKRLSAALVVFFAFLAAGCGGVSGGSGSSNHGPVATTSLSPAPGDFVTSIAVSLTTDIPADVIFTVDGSDPKSSATRQTKPSPAKVTLTKLTDLKYYSKTSAGAEEAVRTATYRRVHYAGGAVVVGESVVGLPVGLLVMQGTQTVAQIDVGTPTAAGEMPFTLDQLDVGDYSLRAIALPTTFGPNTDISLTAAKPYADDVKVYLAAPKPDTGTLKGTVTFGMEMPSKGLVVVPLPSSILSGTSMDPNALAGLLDPSNANIFVTITTSALSYQYSITGLTPGTYIPLCGIGDPASGLGGGGAFNLLLSPFNMKQVTANQETTADFQFGAASIEGNLTVNLSQELPSGAQLNVVIGGRGGLTDIQALRIPVTVSLSEGSTTEYKGTFTAEGLRNSQQFQLKVFATTDGTDPSQAVLTWLVNPLATGDTAVRTNGATSADITVNEVVP